jgi:predicted Rossmann-fold nucleotide-binding protein
VRRRIGLVYGGGSVGIMGTVSRAAHAAGGYVLGVIPSDLAHVEVSGESVGEVLVVDNMHTRKATMARGVSLRCVRVCGRVRRARGQRRCTRRCRVACALGCPR